MSQRSSGLKRRRRNEVLSATVYSNFLGSFLEGDKRPDTCFRRNIRRRVLHAAGVTGGAVERENVRKRRC